MTNRPWNGRGKPPGYKETRPTVRPHSIDDTFARVTCPRCGQTHAYGADQLAPLPVQNGDTRQVLCQTQQAALALQRIGHRYSWRLGYDGMMPLPFYIQFRSKETP